MPGFFYGIPDRQPWENVASIFATHNLSSERTSSLPFVQFWKVAKGKDISNRIKGFLYQCNEDFVRAFIEGQRCFEYPVPVYKKSGRGKPSMTDLMLVSPECVVAIEAKYTESMTKYESIEKWKRRNDGTDNKDKVLFGWLKYIKDANALNHSITNEYLESLSIVPYQLVHRIASACSLCVGMKTMRSPNVIYQLFFNDDEGNDKAGVSYNDVESLAKDLVANYAALKLNETVKFYIVATPTNLEVEPPADAKQLFIEMLHKNVYSFRNSKLLFRSHS